MTAFVLWTAPDGSSVDYADDATLTVTTTDASGNTIGTRPYTDAEVAAASVRAQALADQQAALAAAKAFATQVAAIPPNQQQALADAAAWPTADAATRDQIMGRVLTGLAELLGGLQLLTTQLPKD